MAIYGDELRPEAPLATRVGTMAAARTIPGIWIDEVAGRNRIGIGTLRIDAARNANWQAPFSPTAGAAIDVGAGGTFTLADGADPNRWIQVVATAASLPTSAAEARVRLMDVYNNGVVGTDRIVNIVPSTHSIVLVNQHSAQLTNATAWLDALTPASHKNQLKIGATTGRPYNEADALALFGGQTIAIGAALTLTIAPDTYAAGTHRQLARIFVSFDDEAGGKAMVELRGLYRAAEIAGEYQAFHTEDADPDPESDTPFATNISLPWTPATVFGDGDHRFALQRQNEHGLGSGSRDVQRIVISGGNEQDETPTGPDWLSVTQIAGGVPRVEARYLRPGVAARQADTWALWYTIDGSAPGAGDPDVTQSVYFAGRGLAILRYNLTAQADAVVVRVLVRMRLAAGPTDSETEIEQQITIDLTGPAAPADGTVLRGKVV